MELREKIGELWKNKTFVCEERGKMFEKKSRRMYICNQCNATWYVGRERDRLSLLVVFWQTRVLQATSGTPDDMRAASEMINVLVVVKTFALVKDE